MISFPQLEQHVNKEYLEDVTAEVYGSHIFVMATRKMHALVQVHLTTANQSEIRKAYLVSVSVIKVWKVAGGSER